MFPVNDSNNGKKKWAGRSKGRVVDNRDPLQRGRIRADHPILGITGWIFYLNSPGSFSMPSIGDLVYIECEAGFPEYPVAWGNPIKGLDATPDVPAEFRRDIPSNRGLHTPGGHLVELDDGIGTLSDDPDDTDLTTTKRGIRITSSASNKIHIAEDSDTGQEFILIEDAGGNVLKLDYAQNQLTINSIGSTNFSTSEDRTDTVGGNLTVSIVGNCTITCADASVNASGDVAVDAAGDATVDASQIELNGSAGKVITTNTDPIIDTIFGGLHTGVSDVKAGS